MNVTIFQINNSFNRNKVTIMGRWNRWTISLAVALPISLLAYFLLQ